MLTTENEIIQNEFIFSHTVFFFFHQVTITDALRISDTNDEYILYLILYYDQTVCLLLSAPSVLLCIIFLF